MAKRITQAEWDAADRTAKVDLAEVDASKPTSQGKPLESGPIGNLDNNARGRDLTAKE